MNLIIESFQIFIIMFILLMLPFLLLNLLFFFLTAPWGMQDPSSLTRDWTHAPCIESKDF